MGTQWVGPKMTVAEAVEQGLHDARHPGKVCQTCPTERVRDREFEQRRAAWAKREEWRMRWLPWLIGAIVIGCWLLGSWLLGGS
jgi:hypothetical protein